MLNADLFIRRGASVYEARQAIRAYLASISWADWNAGRVLAELCGLPLAPGNEGHSLRPLLHNPRACWDHPAYSVWSEDGQTLHGVMVRNEKWRYAEYGLNGEKGAMLFHPQADPFEMKNLADDPAYARVRAELSPLARKYASNLGKTQV